MAILNLTDDSFSDDGVGDDVGEAVRRAVQAQTDGADIIDIGGETARADRPVRDATAEADQVAETIRNVRRECDLLISADTYKPAVAEAALEAGAHMINDIAGFHEGDETARLAARYGAAFVVNYSSSPPKIRPSAPLVYDDLIAAHVTFLRDASETALAAGVRAESIVIDPGIAFGKSHDEDLEILRRLSALKELQLPLLVAASRKHFIGSVTEMDPHDRDAATVAVTALSVANGADVVRVHDVRSNVHAARVADAIVRGQLGDWAPGRHWPWAAGSTPLPGTAVER